MVRLVTKDFLRKTLRGISMMLARGLASDFDHHARRARG